MSNIAVAAIMAGATDGAILARATVGVITVEVIIAVAMGTPTPAMVTPTPAMPILIIILMPILPLTSASVSAGAVGDAVELLQESLEEEEAADEARTKIAINQQAEAA
jgi:hypothetical protein